MRATHAQKNPQNDVRDQMVLILYTARKRTSANGSVRMTVATLAVAFACRDPFFVLGRGSAVVIGGVLDALKRIVASVSQR